MKTKKNILNDHSEELDTEKYNPATEGLSIGNPCTDIPIGMAENKGTFAGLSRKNNAAHPGPTPTSASPANAAATGDPSRSPKHKRQTKSHRYLSDPPLPGSESDIFIETNGMLLPGGEAIPAAPPIINLANILVGLPGEPKNRAIARAGEQLVAGGYVHPFYIASMMLRETITPSSCHKGVVIIQGTEDGKREVIHSGVVILQYPTGILFNQERAYLIIGVASRTETHPKTDRIIQRLTQDKQFADQLRTLLDKRIIYDKIKL